MEATTWRVGQFDARGGDLTLSELRLHGPAGVVDASATLTSSHTPTAGSLANLIDGNPATTCTFAAGDVRSAGFWIQWTLPADEEVRTIRASGTPLRRLALMVGGDAFDALALAGSGYQEMVPYPYIETLLSLGPVAAWALDEAGGTQTDLVGSNDGVRTGGTTAPTQMFLPDTIAFDPETTGLVRVAANSYDVDSFSVVFDIRTTEAQNTVLIEHGSNNFGWTVQISPSLDGTVQFSIAGNTQAIRSALPINDNRAHRVVLTYSTARGRAIYIDGRYSVGLWLSSGPPSYNTSYIDIGSRNGNFGPGNGSALSNVAIFDRELTPAEARRLQGAPLTLDTTPVGADVFLGSDTPTGIEVTYLHDATASWRDAEFSGPGVILGTVKRENIPTNVPLRRRVRLHRDADGMLVRETWSDPITGAYEFRDMSMQYRYTVITYDYEHNYRAVIADNLQAVLP